VFTLQTIPSWEDDDCFAQVAKQSGFSLYAGVAAQTWDPARSWSAQAEKRVIAQATQTQILSQVICMIYDAVDDPYAWPALLGTLAQLLEE
jgi:hypothetical protein